jgi:hypothetical protein
MLPRSGGLGAPEGVNDHPALAVAGAGHRVRTDQAEGAIVATVLAAMNMM